MCGRASFELGACPSASDENAALRLSSRIGRAEWIEPVSTSMGVVDAKIYTTYQLSYGLSGASCRATWRLFWPSFVDVGTLVLRRSKDTNKRERKNGRERRYHTFPPFFFFSLSLIVVDFTISPLLPSHVFFFFFVGIKEAVMHSKEMPPLFLFSLILCVVLGVFGCLHYLVGK